MMRVLIVGSRHNQLGEEANLLKYGRYFQKVADGLGEVKHAMLDDLLLDISPSRFVITDCANRLDIKQYDLIIFRGRLREELDLVFAVCQYAEIHKIKTVNDYSQYRSVSKVAQAVNFYKLGVPSPRTIYGRKEFLISMIESGDLETPFIYKQKLGAHGDDNFLIETKSQLHSIKLSGMISQPYIPNDGDYRIFILGTEHLVINRQAVDGTHLNNTSKGGSAVLVQDFDKNIIDESKKIAAAMSMTAAGVDVIFDKNTGKHYILEINSQPQFMSGAFLNEKEKLVRGYFATLLPDN